MGTVLLSIIYGIKYRKMIVQYKDYYSAVRYNYPLLLWKSTRMNIDS